MTSSTKGEQPVVGPLMRKCFQTLLVIALFACHRSAAEVEATGPRRNNVFVQTGRQAKSPTKMQAKSPTQMQAKSPTQMQAKSPTKKQTKSPTKKQTKSPIQKQTKSPTKKQTNYPAKKQTKSPMQKQTLSRRVIMTLEDADLGDIAPMKIAAFEDTFKIAYSKKASKYRSIVDLDKVQTYETTNDFGSQDINVVFDVNFKCKRCKSDDTLFRYARPKQRSLSLEDVMFSSVTHQSDTALKIKTESRKYSPRRLKGALFTPEAFTLEYNKNLAKVAANTNTQLLSVLEWTELYLVSCSKDVEQFESILITEFEGDPEALTSAELEVLEQAFLDSYNSLNSLNEATCDPFFKAVIYVEAEVLDEDSSLKRPLIGKVKFRKFNVKFRVGSNCKGCGTGKNLLNNDASRRRLEWDHSRRKAPRNLQDGGDDCKYCRIGADLLREPTRTEFDFVFEQTITNQIANGSLPSISQVFKTSEVVETTCPVVQMEIIQTTLKLRACGDSNSALSTSQTSNAASAIKASLDELFSLFCGDSSRTILDVAYLSKSTANDCASIEYLFRVNFECLDCAPGSTLLSDVTSEVAQTSILQVGASFSASDQCYCDIDAIVDRLPTEEELFSIVESKLLSSSITPYELVEDGYSNTYSPASYPSVAPNECCPGCNPEEALQIALSDVNDPDVDPLIPRALIDEIIEVAQFGLMPGVIDMTERIITIASGVSFASISGSFEPANGFLFSDAKVSLFGLEGFQGSSGLSDGQFEIILTEALPLTNPYFVVVSKLTSTGSCDPVPAASLAASIGTVLVSNSVCSLTNSNATDGTLSVTLTWGSVDSDIDLHIIEPDGNEVYYASKFGAYGSLDFDDTQGYGPENYVATNPGSGDFTFQFYVVAYSLFSATSPVRWTLRAFVGQTALWTESGTFSATLERSANFVVNLQTGGTALDETPISDVCSPTAVLETSWCQVRQRFGLGLCSESEKYLTSSVDDTFILEEFDKGGSTAAKIILSVFGRSNVLDRFSYDMLESLSDLQLQSVLQKAANKDACIREVVSDTLCYYISNADYVSQSLFSNLGAFFESASFTEYVIDPNVQPGVVAESAKRFLNDVVDEEVYALEGLIPGVLDVCQKFTDDVVRRCLIQSESYYPIPAPGVAATAAIPIRMAAPTRPPMLA